MKLTRELLDQLFRFSEAAYPEEACGFLIGDPAGAILQVVPITNVAGKMRAERPEEFTRTAADGYVMEPGEQLRASLAAEKAGRVVAGVWHSHPDVGAYFSAEDRARALFDGVPVYPEWLVADVTRGRARDAKAFRWDGRDFVEVPLEVE